MILILRLGLIGLLCAGLNSCESSQPPHKLQIGQNIPSLSVQDLNNQFVTLKPSPGKVLMINVWATWCAPCRHEMPSMQRLYNQLGSDHIELIGLSVDMDEHVVREYLIENKIHFPIC